ncbi:MAG: hypothetical protein H0V74_06665 [Chloroflexi bacterium]|nr:hypothetical protein [Chloroflexota bacterium]
MQTTGLTDRPPGFYLDESSFSWNAWTLVQGGVDEFGRPWPLFFESFGDWKTAPYIYLLAGVFTVTGPSILAARAVSAIAGLATVSLLAWLGYRSTKRPAIGLLTGAAALLNPWTFEPTRLALEVAFMPALVAAFLVVLHMRPPTRDRWVSSALALALVLALITYTYTLGRLLGPLLAAGLVLYVGQRSWKAVLGTWIVYAALCVPLLLFAATNPGALTVRLAEAGYLGGPLPEIVGRFVEQLAGNVDPGRALWVGDHNERHHVKGIMGSLLVGTLLLALVGIVRAAGYAVRDPWARYLLYGLVVSYVPASLTTDPFHVHRLIAVPVFLIALTIPAQAWLLGRGRAVSLRRATFVLLAVAVLAQGAYFQIRYDEAARGRGHWFDDAYPGLLDVALATGETPVYLVDGIVPAHVHGLWYGAVRSVRPERFVHLPRDTRAPSGALVLSSESDCAPCVELASGGFFRLYRVP